MRKIILFIFAMVALNATTPTYENVTRLYVATFDRTPDVAGLKYWVNDSGLELEEITRSFFDQPETKEKYYPDGTLDLGNFVDEVYVNLFDRAPDSAGRAYWIDAMHTGSVHYSTFILAAINGAQGNDATILADKTKYAMVAIEDILDGDKPSRDRDCPLYRGDMPVAYYIGDKNTLGIFCQYFGNGRIGHEEHWYKGKLHGTVFNYWRDGLEIFQQFEYWNGLQHGKTREWDKEGNLFHCKMWEYGEYIGGCMP